MQTGKRGAIETKQQELTIQGAANMLGVSRPIMVKLLAQEEEENRLPFHQVGSQRRLYLKDVVAFKARRDKERHAAIVRMARMEKRAGTYNIVILPPGGADR